MIQTIIQIIVKAITGMLALVVGVFGGGGKPQDAPQVDPEPVSTPTPVVAPPAPTPEPTAAPSPTTEPPAFREPTAEEWAQVRWCESNDNYQINTGNGYYGAYQFSIQTWDWVAGKHRPDLVGVRPDLAAPADQDEMALLTWYEQGKGAWPVCGRVLP